MPFFFMISGYLFFRTYKSSKWKAKIRSRAKSLLIPYLIWNVFYAIVMITLMKIGAVSNMSNVESLSGGVISCINSEYSPLWFVKYLMFFVCISPLMYYVLRNKWTGAVTIIALLVINTYDYYSGNMQVPLNVNANNFIMFVYQYIFYAIGAYAALCWKTQVENPSMGKSIFGAALLGLLLVACSIYNIHYGDVITNHTFRWLWCIAFWLAYDLLPEIKVRPWMKYSFFIYCSHLIFVMCFQGVTRIAYTGAGKMEPVFQIGEYCWLPILTVFVLIKIGNILKGHTPKLWGIITGCRG